MLLIRQVAITLPVFENLALGKRKNRYRNQNCDAVITIIEHSSPGVFILN